MSAMRQEDTLKMKNPIRVRDIMTSEVISLSTTTTVEDAARSLTFHRVSGAPVLDQGRIVGVVSKSDLMNPRNRPATGEKITVGQAMTPVLKAVRPGDFALNAVRLMVEERVHRVVVVSESRKLVGILSAMDVLAALTRGERFEDMDALDDAQVFHADPSVAVAYVDLETLDIAK